MRPLPSAFAVLLCLVPLGVRAQTAPVVLELYTSQGCSSCPPADALLTDLAGRAGVIALALHVDYWDYLGWKDQYGKASNTARQRAYARAVRSRTIFTPEMIVQGETPLKGHDAASILKQIALAQKRAATVTMTLDRDGDELAIHLAPVGASAGPAEVYLVRYIPSVEASIEAGENAGRELTYTNVVTDWDTLARWDGVTPADLHYEGLDRDRPAAVIVQRTHMGPVLTAATLQ